MLFTIWIGLDCLTLILSHRELSSPNSLDLRTTRNGRAPVRPVRRAAPARGVYNTTPGPQRSVWSSCCRRCMSEGAFVRTVRQELTWALYQGSARLHHRSYRDSSLCRERFHARVGKGSGWGWGCLVNAFLNCYPFVLEFYVFVVSVVLNLSSCGVLVLVPSGLWPMQCFSLSSCMP